MHRIYNMMINSTGVRLYFLMQILSEVQKLFLNSKQQVLQRKQVSIEALWWDEAEANFSLIISIPWTLAKPFFHEIL